MPVSRRHFIGTVGGALAMSAAAMRARGAEPAAPEKPNILLLESDQHRYDVLGCAGHPIVKTPNIDALAREGVLLGSTVCQAPLCMPSRVSLITGSYCHNHGVYLNQGYMVDGQWTFTRALQEAGYHTALVGKMHLGGRVPYESFDDPQKIEEIGSYGFDSVHATCGKVMAGIGNRECPYRKYLRERGTFETLRQDYLKRRGQAPHWYAEPSPMSEEDFHDAYIGRKTAEWIRQYDGDEPFFMWANWGGPHAPWDAPGHYGTMYDPNEMDAALEDAHDTSPSQLKRKAENQSGKMPPEAMGKMRAQYYGMVTLVDDAVGAIVDALKQRGWLDNTVIVYCADHGEMLGDHGMFGKSLFYGASVRVPLVIWWPKGLRQGLRTDALVELNDLVPTFLQLAGVRDSGGSYGRSLLPLLTGEADSHRAEVFSELGPAKMVLNEQYKYVHDPRWEKAQLFRVGEDPNELQNLAGTPECAEVEHANRARLLDWLAQTHAHVNSGARSRALGRRAQ